MCERKKEKCEQSCIFLFQIEHFTQYAISENNRIERRKKYDYRHKKYSEIDAYCIY